MKEDCQPSKKLQSTIKMIKKLYEVDTSELCEDEMKMLYMMTKKLRKKVKKLREKE
jgi:Asp-tRNA(Asn)/Glu-tRNA(Gln) amidotransferase C subunit